MDESERGISKLCGLIQKVSQKPQAAIMPGEETGERKTLNPLMNQSLFLILVSLRPSLVNVT